MKYSILLALFILPACAHNDYAPTGNIMKDDLRKCQHDAIKKYNDSKTPMTSGQIAGAVIGGVGGGAIGGAILGSALGSSADDNHTMKLQEIDPYVDNCMHDKGYTGHSY